MQGVVFKQSYKPVNQSRTSLLNRKHLIYIATRPGAVHNPQCGFGLFGKLPGMCRPADILSLEQAKTTVTQASKQHTLYRAIFSLDGETALEKGYYDRARWEQLLYRNIQALAKEMDIQPNDLCWAASFHHAKGHPHVHVLYWDNSARVRQEHIPEERFSIVAEHVRAALNRTIFQGELQQLRGQQDETRKAIQEELRVLCRECNPEGVFDFSHLTAAHADTLGEQLLQLAANLPRTGRLAYKYLPSGYQEELDGCIRSILEISDFKKLAQRFYRLTDEAAELYGNDDARKAFQRERAGKALYTEMGNQLLRFLRTYREQAQAEVSRTTPMDETAFTQTLRQRTRTLLQQDGAIREKYQALLRQMPAQRTPMQSIMQPEFAAQFRRLSSAVMRDAYIKLAIRAYIDQHDHGTADTGPLQARLLYASCRSAVNSALCQQLQADAGYPAQEQVDMAVMALIQLFRTVSQGVNHQQSILSHNQRRFSELSETAKRDRLRKKEQEGGWDIPGL